MKRMAGLMPSISRPTFGPAQRADDEIGHHRVDGAFHLHDLDVGAFFGPRSGHTGPEGRGDDHEESGCKARHGVL